MAIVEDTPQAATEAGSDHGYYIGEVSALTGLTPRTLRHYDDLGVVQPVARSSGQFRVYGERQLAQLRLIKSLRPLGLDLPFLKVLLGALDVPPAGERGDAVERDAAAVLRTLERRRDEAARQLEDAAASIDGLRRAIERSAAIGGPGPVHG